MNFKSFYGKKKTLKENTTNLLKSLNENLDENVEDCKLNQVFWNDDKPPKLQEDVRGVLLKVAEDVVENLSEELEEPFEYSDLIFTGSLTSPNYDLISDVDLHFTLEFDEDSEIFQKYLKFYAKNFNDNKYTLLQHPLEIYFQDVNEPHLSPGIYSVKNDEWVKQPDCVILDMNPEILVVADQKLKEIEQFIEEYNNYNGNKEEFLENLRTYKDALREMRQKGLKSEDNMYSFENLVFKQLRRNNALQKLNELIRQIQDDIYEVER